MKEMTLQDAEELLFEKAHYDGEMHPNGKWVWRSSAAGGKGDWRVANKKSKSSEDNKSTGDSSKKEGNKTLSDHAKNTSDETLKKVVESDKAPETLKNAAKKELESRGKEKTEEKTSYEDNTKELFQKINKLLPAKKGDTLLAIHKTLNGKNTYNIITKTSRGLYRAAEVNLDRNFYDFESKPYGTEREAMNFSETGKSNARYKDVSKQLNDWKRIEPEKNNNSNNNPKSDKASDFKIINVNASSIASNLAEVLGGKVLPSVVREVKYSNGSKINTSVIQVGDEKLFIHDGVFQLSYDSKGYSRLQGFTIESESGKRLIYKLNSTKTGFTNAYSTTVGELGKFLKNQWFK